MNLKHLKAGREFKAYEMGTYIKVKCVRVEKDIARFEIIEEDHENVGLEFCEGLDIVGSEYYKTINSK